MAHSLCPSGLPSDKNISLSATRVIVKTPGSQKIFIVTDDTSVRQFKEKLSAYFKCKMDQLVLVFMGRLLKDHDTLRQRGILNGHTIHLVIKTKQGSRSQVHSSKNFPSNKPCRQDRNNKNTKGNINGVTQPAGLSQNSHHSSKNLPSNKPCHQERNNKNTKGNRNGTSQPTGISNNSVESDAYFKPNASKLSSQNLKMGRQKYVAPRLENPIRQWLLSNSSIIDQFIEEHPDMQQLMKQDPDISHIFHNFEILCQTLELARKFAMIQEIVKICQPANNLEQPLYPQSHRV